MVYEFSWRTSLILVAFGLCLRSAYGDYDSKPHIIVFMVDDLGWNDVGFHGSSQIPTPNIDALAYNGIILNKHYVQPSCTPTRAAFFSGKYPIRMGMQGEGIMGGEMRGLPLNITILPQYLSYMGYTTALIGKWHLGFVTPEHTPTYRGFQSFLGFYNSHVSYYDYKYEQARNMSGYDMHRDGFPAYGLPNVYATDLFTDKAVEIIKNQSDLSPLYLQLSHLGVHAPVEAPKDDFDDHKYKHIKDANRRRYAKSVVALDRSLGRVVNALFEKHMLQDSIILFLTDNGAPTVGKYPNRGSNAPLRGMKYTLYEGGVRGVAAIWSKELRHSAFVSKDLIHVTDWLPTLYAAAGGNVSHLGDIDGVNQWPYLSKGKPHPRDRILLNIDEFSGAEAAIEKRYKFIRAHYRNPHYNEYTGESGKGSEAPEYNTSEVTASMVSRAFASTGEHPTQPSTMVQMREQATVSCGRLNLTNFSICSKNEECLFDLDLDPCETTNIAERQRMVVDNLTKFLSDQFSRLMKRPKPHINAAADPKRRNNTWEPWLSESDYGFNNAATGIGIFTIYAHIGLTLFITGLQAFI